jgi:cyclopropane fatty-acyl-phospholipid synthase-like methyltransferase
MHAVFDAVQQGVFLGILDAGGLQDVTDAHYRSTQTDASGDVNYFSPEHNASGLFGWERSAIDAHFAECKAVLVAAAGGGREALALARHGFKVDAFDCNDELVESCRSFVAAQAADVQVFHSNPNDVPEFLGTYDGAILGLGSYTHIVGRQQRIDFLKSLHRHLRPGAPLVLSFRTYTDSRSRRVTYRLATLVRTLRRADPVEPGDALNATFLHLFTNEEIRQELTAAGFDLVSCHWTHLARAVATAVPVAAEAPCPR